MSELGDRLTELRKYFKMTQAIASERMNIGRSTLNNYENGIREPSIDTLKSIADFYDVTVDYLLGRTEDSTSRLTHGQQLLLQASKNATDEEIEQAIKIIEALKK